MSGLAAGKVAPSRPSVDVLRQGRCRPAKVIATAFERRARIAGLDYVNQHTVPERQPSSRMYQQTLEIQWAKRSARSPSLIYLDDQDLAEFDLRAVRRQLGVVLHSVEPRPGSIMSTILGSCCSTRRRAHWTT